METMAVQLWPRSGITFLLVVELRVDVIHHGHQTDGRTDVKKTNDRSIWTLTEKPDWVPVVCCCVVGNNVAMLAAPSTPYLSHPLYGRKCGHLIGISWHGNDHFLSLKILRIPETAFQTTCLEVLPSDMNFFKLIKICIQGNIRPNTIRSFR